MVEDEIKNEVWQSSDNQTNFVDAHIKFMQIKTESL
jgi:hypothetical protein